MARLIGGGENPECIVVMWSGSSFHVFTGAIDSYGTQSVWQDPFVTLRVIGRKPILGGRLTDQGFGGAVAAEGPYQPNSDASEYTLAPVARAGSAGVDLPLQSLIHELPVATT
jgi:hypothetical protein